MEKKDHEAKKMDHSRGHFTSSCFPYFSLSLHIVCENEESGGREIQGFLFISGYSKD